MTAQAIMESDVLSTRNFRRCHQQASRPVVFKLERPALLDAACPQALASRYADVPVQVQYEEQLTEERYGPVAERYRKVSLGTFVEELLDSGPSAPYLSQFPLSGTLREFESLLDLPAYLWADQ